MIYLYIIITILILVFSIKLKAVFLISSFSLQLIAILINYIYVNYPAHTLDDLGPISGVVKLIPYLSVLSYLLLLLYVIGEYRKKKHKNFN